MSAKPRVFCCEFRFVQFYVENGTQCFTADKITMVNLN